MSIEELSESGRGRQPDGSLGRTTVLSACAGVLLGAVMTWAVSPQAFSTISPSPVESAAVVLPSPSPATPLPSPRPASVIATGLLASVRQSLTVDGVSFSFRVPADGWARYGSLYISKSDHGPQGAEAMIFWARHPVGHDARLCSTSPTTPIGTTVAEVAAGLATSVAGTELVAGPTEVTVAGIAAMQVRLFVRDYGDCGPGFFYSWEGEDSRDGPMWGGPLLGDTITIWVLEVQGERFLIAAEEHLNAGRALAAEVQQVIDSIQFEEPELNSDGYAQGRHSTTVDSTTFSFAIGRSGWEPYPWDEGPLGSTLISKSISGPQGAEEVIYWAGYPESFAMSPCGSLQDAARPPSTLGVATRVATAPGTQLVTGPEEVTVGGHRAVHVVVTVDEAVGCDPGFFLSWTPQRGGAMWTETGVGDTIRVWVVEVDAGIFFIAAVTTPDAAERDGEIQQIIDSIQFAEG
jgi:hypothetical protein